MNYPSLFTPLRLGTLVLPNRVVMAPLTRMRSGDGQGYPRAPGLYTAAQVAGWRRVTDAVHSRGGRILAQLAHNGRNSHSSFMPDGGPPFAPSAIPPDLPGFTADFRQVPIEMPRVLRSEQISAIYREIPGSCHERHAGRI